MLAGVPLDECYQPLVDAVEHGEPAGVGYVVEAVVAALHLKVRHQIRREMVPQQSGAISAWVQHMNINNKIYRKTLIPLLSMLRSMYS